MQIVLGRVCTNARSVFATALVYVFGLARSRFLFASFGLGRLLWPSFLFSTCGLIRDDEEIMSTT